MIRLTICSNFEENFSFLEAFVLNEKKMDKYLMQNAVKILVYIMVHAATTTYTLEANYSGFMRTSHDFSTA